MSVKGKITQFPQIPENRGNAVLQAFLSVKQLIKALAWRGGRAVILAGIDARFGGIFRIEGRFEGQIGEILRSRGVGFWNA